MKWARRGLWAVGAVLLLWGVAWLAVPPLVKWQAEKRLSELTGRQVTLGAVAFSPWALRLSLSDLAIAPAPGATATEPQFSLAGLSVDVDAASLLRLAPVVSSLQIDTPRLRVARTAEGQYDFDDVLKRFASPPDAPHPGETPRFAIYNVELRNGELLFDDVPVKKQHSLSELTLTLPFLSSLTADVEVKVEPRLAFKLNGAGYDSGAQAVPFAQSRNGNLGLRVNAFEFEPYLGYLPESLPVRLKRGRVDADLALDFAAPANAPPSVKLRGKVSVVDVAVDERGGEPLLAVKQVALALEDVQPLARKVALGALRVDGLELHLSRDAHGVTSIERLRPATAPSTALPASAASAPAASTASPPAWQLSLESFDLAGARVLWDDAAVQPASSWALEDVTLSARKLSLPSAAVMPFSFKATLRPQAASTTTLATIAVDGEAAASAVAANFELSSVALAAVAPYLNAAAQVQVAGTGAAQGKLEWAAKTDDKAQRIVVSLAELTLDGLKVGLPAAGKARAGDMLGAQLLQVKGMALDLTAQSVAIASVKLRRPELDLQRSPEGIWNVTRVAKPEALAESERPLVRAAAELTWQLKLDELALEDGRLRFNDGAPTAVKAGDVVQPVRLNVDKLGLSVKNVQLRGERLVSTPQVQLSVRVADAGMTARDVVATAGLIDWRGQFGLEPLSVKGKLRVERLPLHAVRAYGVHGLGVRLMHADAGFKGDVSVRHDAASGLTGDLSGDVRLSDLRVDEYHPTVDPQPAPGEEQLLSWQLLAVNGLSVALRPGAVPKVIFREATLNDYFASLVLTEQGNLNLNRVVPHREAAAEPATAAASSVVSATKHKPAPATRRIVAAVSSAASSATTAAVNALPVDLDVGGVRLVGGHVDFSDRFVKPNYSAKLTELNGSLGAFRTGSGDPAVLQLSGRVAGTGLLEIGGKLKPGSVPKELDIAAKATDIELAPLSAYSGKYAGYAIERGKLSVEVHYKIDPNGKLDASHQVILNQLTFGDRVESPDATKLPVRFVVSLLKDRNGVIDLNLPVSGTIDDPQFSLGPLIWKVIVNLIVKIVSSPFAMFSGGSGTDLSVVPFQPGTGQPTVGGVAAIDKVAKALNDRPSLKMTVTGEADVDAEREAFQRATVEQRLLQEQRREQLRASAAASAPAAAPALAEADRARLVRELYRQTDLPDKPRNVIGLKADIATAEMEALLRANVQASPEAMRELALQRGLVVRDALVAKGLANDRLFLGDPKLRTGAVSAASAASEPSDAAWTPQVKLSLDNK